MKKRYLVLYLSLTLLLVLESFTGCTPTPVTSIGSIVKLTATVEAGPAGGMAVVDPSRDLNSGDSVHVSGGHGRARVTLVGGTVVIELFNNTSGSTGVSGSGAALAYLSQGGLRTSVTQGSTCIVNVPNGGQFTILGTEMFVVYDPETQYTTAGNFHGKVLWTAPGKTEQTLEEQTMIDIAPDGTAQIYPLPFNPADFDQALEDSGSPVGGMRTLRERFGIPPIHARSGITTRTLVGFDGTTMLPDLAQKWDVSKNAAGGVTWTFYLQGDVKLENGEPFTSAHVAEMVKQQASPQNMEGVGIIPIDDTTIAFEFPQGADPNGLLQELSKIPFLVQQ